MNHEKLMKKRTEIISDWEKGTIDTNTLWRKLQPVEHKLIKMGVMV